MRLFLLTQTLVENFTHIGFQKAALNHAYRFYVVGSHSNVSIINPALTATALRRLVRVLLLTARRRLKACFITHKLPPEVSGKTLFFRQQYCLDYWVPGTFSNRRFSCLYRLKTSRVSLRRRRVPAVVVLLGLSQKKSYEIYKETRSRNLFCFSLLDSDTNPSIYSYFIPTNTKSLVALYFFLDLFSLIFNYGRSLDKNRFATYVFKKKKRV